jgi:hypothetical protein
VVHATLSRHGVVYATGISVPATRRGSPLVLNETRHVVAGVYTLTLRSRHRHGWVIRREPVTIG